MSVPKFKAILCDIGGVLYSGDRAIEGAIETIDRLKESYPIRFLTNTTQKTSQGVLEKLLKLGFYIIQKEIITTLDITKMYLKKE